MAVSLQRRTRAQADIDEAVARLPADERKLYDRLCREFMVPEFTVGPVQWRIYDPNGERHAVPEDEWDVQEGPFETYDEAENCWGYALSAPGYLDTTGWYIGSGSIESTIAELLQNFADNLPDEEDED